MTGVGRRMVTAAAFLVLIGGCSGGSGSSSTTTAAAPATTSSVTTTTSALSPTTSAAPTTTLSTTTSTTLPPGLDPQVLSFGYEPELLARYDALETTTTSTSLTTRPTGVFSGIQGDHTLSSDLGGELWQFVLPGPEASTFEVIWDFRPEEGSVGGEGDDYSYSEALELESLDDFGGIIGPAIVDQSGMVVGDPAAASWFWKVSGDRLGRMTMAGPPLPDGAVDIGDRWSVEYRDPIYGSIPVSAEVTDEVAVGEVLGYVIEYSGSVSGISHALGRTVASRLILGSEGELGPAALSVLADAADDEISVAATGVLIEGRSILDPATGLVLELDSSVRVRVDVEISRGDDGLALTAETETELAANLIDAHPAEGFERVSVLDRFGIEARGLAESGLEPLIGYEIVDVEEGELDWVFWRLEETPAVVGSIVYAKFSNGEQTAFVFSMVSDGRFRAAPILGEGLVYLWTPLDPHVAPPRWKQLNGEQIFHLPLPGDDWTVWTSDTHVFVVIADNPIRDELTTVLMKGQPDTYVWQAGDCLDLTNPFQSEVPWAPLGSLGLRHCQGPHTWDVIESWEIDGEYSADLDVVASQRCGEVYFEQFGGVPLLQGMELAVFSPNRKEWDAGRRYGACAVAQYDTQGIVTRDGRLTREAVSADFDFEVGDCVIGSNGAMVPVPCSVAHRGEIVQIVSYEAGGDGPPDPSVMDTIMAARCRDEMWRPGRPDSQARASAITNMFTAWDQGVREYYCVASIYDEYGWPADIKGDFYGDWEFAEEQVGT